MPVRDQEITGFIRKPGFGPKSVERSAESFAKVKAGK